MRRVLSIAGSDSGGGAGIQADLKTFMALGCYGASAITALTAQNTQGVHGIFPVSSTFIADQINCVLQDIGADAIKIGMLFNATIIETVAKILKPFSGIPIILDPVMIAQSGHALSEKDAILSLKEYLFPMAFVVTPNLDESTALVGNLEVESAAQKILSMGPKAVLIKGGHRDPNRYPEARDYLLCSGQAQGTYYSSAWVHTQNTHGTGCTLSAAIAAYLAKGFELPQAVSKAKNYLFAALSKGASQKIGFGAGPVCHNWKIL